MQWIRALYSRLHASCPLYFARAGRAARKARAFAALVFALAALAAGLGAKPAYAQLTPVSEIIDSQGNSLMVVYENGELEVTGGFVLPDGTLIDESSDLGGGFSLPLSSSASTSDPLLELTQTGTGSAGEFFIDNTDSFTDALLAANSGTGNALKGLQTGTGRAGLFQILNETSSANALAATTNGTGRAANFTITNVDNSSPALFAETVGIGRAGLFRIANSASGAEVLRAESNGRSHAGVFEVDNISNDSSAVQASTNGTGHALQGIQQGAEGRAGDFQVKNSSNVDAALFAETVGTGPAVEGVQIGIESDSSAHAGLFRIVNSNSDAEALLVETNGSGEAVEGIQTGTGAGATAGSFLNINSNNNEAALRAKTFGSGLAAKLVASKNATVRDNPAGNVVLMRNNSDQSGPDVLGLQAGPSSPDRGVNYVSFYDRNGSSVGAIEGNGSGGVHYKTSGADYAEALPVAKGAPVPAPAELVGVRGGTVGLSTDGADRLMVVTRQAAVLGNAPSSAEAKDGRRVPVAFVGQVPVKTRGKVHPGDWIVASGRGDGTARAIAPADYRPVEHGPIAGQAWSGKTSAGIGEVTVAVGLGHTVALAERLQDQQRQIDMLRGRVRALEELKGQQKQMAAQVAALKARPSNLVRAGWSGSPLLAVLLGLGGLAVGLLWRFRS